MKADEGPGARPKALTIGAVVELLKPEFSDVSISKIRYLEDEQLIAPKRTPGGYRLFSKADVERLRTILALQRDEFLPPKVSRQELSRKGTVAVRPASGRPPPTPARVFTATPTGRPRMNWATAFPASCSATGMCRPARRAPTCCV